MPPAENMDDNVAVLDCGDDASPMSAGQYVPRPYLELAEDGNEDSSGFASAAGPRPYLETGDGEDGSTLLGSVFGQQLADEGPLQILIGTAPPAPPPRLGGLEDDFFLANDSSPRQLSDGGGESPASCKSYHSTGSSAEFFQPDQTLLLIDWDDTLCPSTYCMRTLELNVFSPVPESVRPALDQVAKMAQRVLEEADGYGKVVIVTNAEEGWVELSCKNWLPTLWATVQRVAHVVSARTQFEPLGVTSPAGWKQRAFQAEIERFYGRYPHQSWKNVLSIGDAPHEREALLRVTWSNNSPKCRPKSIKFMVRPNLDQLLRELDTLRANLKEVVYHNDRLDLQFDGE